MKKDIIVIIKNKIEQLIIQKIIHSYKIPLNTIYGLKYESLFKFLENYDIPLLLIEVEKEQEFQKLIKDIRNFDKNLQIIIYCKNIDLSISDVFINNYDFIIYSTDPPEQIANTFFKIIGNQKEASSIDEIQKKVRESILFSLSTQESIVVNLLLNGYTVTKISNKQGISITTVIAIKKRIFEKFNVKSIIEFRILFKDSRSMFDSFE